MTSCSGPRIEPIPVLRIETAHDAILPKRDGFQTKNVDYIDREGLVEKYREFKQYSPDDIEDVDYVIPAGASMADVIHDRFDLVLASHVLEHSISLIDFINDCTDLLTPDGVLSLVVPDHRYCFDRFRERSSIGRVIDTSINLPQVHTVGTMTEFLRLRQEGWPDPHQSGRARLPEGKGRPARLARGRQRARPDGVEEQPVSLLPAHLPLSGRRNGGVR